MTEICFTSPEVGFRLLIWLLTNIQDPEYSLVGFFRRIFGLKLHIPHYSFSFCAKLS